MLINEISKIKSLVKWSSVRTIVSMIHNTYVCYIGFIDLALEMVQIFYSGKSPYV